jgi:hypothetical protein
MNPAMLCPVGLLAAGAGVLSVRAFNAEIRSARLGLAAASCGVAAFIPALIGPMFSDPSQMAALAACGVLTMLIAAAAVVLAIRTMRARRRDQGVGRGYAIAGLFCGIANLFCGAGVWFTRSGWLVPTDGTPWTWQSEEYGFEVTVPSERWVIRSNPNVLVQFSCARPPLVAIVAKAFPAKSDSEYEAALAYGRKARTDTAMIDVDERSGLNRHGHAHWLYMGNGKAKDGPYFFGVSITRFGDKAVLMMFEGPYPLTTDAGRAQLARSLREQAELFLGSVK